jgi:2-(1,2-epoxy-1,2-dihydrophenyl)acetyl-CoA isomerase
VSSSDALDVDTGTDTVLAVIRDRVGVITLNRPKRRNALHPEMFEAVPRVLDGFATNADVGCVVITGSGSAFCSGGDVRDGGGEVDRSAPTEAVIAERAADLTRHARMVELLHAMPKPTLAALPGPAVGAGMSIALAANMRIAARSARLIPGWGQLAFSGDFGGAWFLTRLVGPALALELLIDGSPIDAERAAELGLVNRVVDDTELAEAALTWARQLANGPTGAWVSMKANVFDAETLPLDAALVRESERMVRCGMSDEHRTAVRAWLRAANADTRSSTKV